MARPAPPIEDFLNALELRVAASEAQVAAVTAAHQALVDRVAALEPADPPDVPPVPMACIPGTEEVRIGELELEPCQPDGTQTFEETWERRGDIPATHGGAPCGPTTWTTVVKRSCDYVPPEPDVNCELGPDEFITSETPLEACQPDGFQAVEVAWRRDVLTPATGNGTCVSSGTRIEKRACVYVPPPDPVPGDDPHAHFDLLSARPSCILSESLRNQAQLDALTKGGTSVFWKFDPPDPMDAARLFKPPRNTFSQYPDLAYLGDSGDEGVHSNRALRFGIAESSETLFLTWDVRFGEEFHLNTLTAPGFAFKMYFLFCGNGPFASADFYQVYHERYTGGGLDYAAGQISRHHDQSAGTLAPGVIRRDPFQPTGHGAPVTGTFPTYHSVWTRYGQEIRPNQDGSLFTEWADAHNGGVLPVGLFDMVSLWMWDELRQRQRVLYRVPFVRPFSNATGLPNTHIGQFRFAFDTSSNNVNGTGLSGPLIAHARNVVLLHGETIDEANPIFWTQPKPTVLT